MSNHSGGVPAADSGVLNAARADIAGLSVFSNVRRHPLVCSLEELLGAVEDLNNTPVLTNHAEPAINLFRRWAAFIENHITYSKNYSFYEYIAFLSLTSDNAFTRAAESGKAPSLLLQATVEADLDRLGRIAAFDIVKLGFAAAKILQNSGLDAASHNIEAEARAFWIDEGNVSRRAGSAGNSGPAGNVQTRTFAAAVTIFPPGENWIQALPRFAAYIRAHGAGDLALHHFFYWAEKEPAAGSGHSRLLPVHSPDTICLADFAGYESQRSVIIANTLRFIEGSPANNLLLHGDRGTGKSAAIKAVCNEFAARGLRLLEVRKGSLFELPRILDAIAARSLRFVIFIDDLSFETIDDSFTCLKAILEGGAETRPPNAVIYATSNRRHLVKETITSRPGLSLAAADLNGEVRAFETMQEQFSLADRFGLSLVFTAPDQEEYLRIAEHIAGRRGALSSDNAAAGGMPLCDIETFRRNALRWEKWFNGRSPRTAVQYVDWILGGADFPWE
ncbi:MAG: ATP-binding protein [Treponema sp.]|jgi:predicted AAA+ superfamily ATPase|nr:ATP-binding protein [Treponema sp.]